MDQKVSFLNDKITIANYFIQRASRKSCCNSFLKFCIGNSFENVICFRLKVFALYSKKWNMFLTQNSCTLINKKSCSTKGCTMCYGFIRVCVVVISEVV